MGGLAANFVKKILIEFKYLAKIAIILFYVSYIDILELHLKKVIYIIKASKFLLSANLANFFFIIFTYHIFDRVRTIM